MANEEFDMDESVHASSEHLWCPMSTPDLHHTASVLTATIERMPLRINAEEGFRSLKWSILQ